MSVALILLTVHLVTLYTLDGHEVFINPKQVTSLHAAKEGSQNQLFADDVNCVIGLTDGKFVSVVANCNTVKQLLEGAQ